MVLPNNYCYLAINGNHTPAFTSIPGNNIFKIISWFFEISVCIDWGLKRRLQTNIFYLKFFVVWVPLQWIILLKVWKIIRKLVISVVKRTLTGTTTFFRNFFLRFHFYMIKSSPWHCMPVSKKPSVFTNLIIAVCITILAVIANKFRVNKSEN